MGMLSKASSKSLALLAGITILFRWKTLLTHEFTILSEDETVNQAYSWYSFCLRVIRHGVPALWDPYTFAGHSFIGEMQTSGLSPFNFLLAIFPPDSYGLLREQVYNWYIAALIFLALAFMYWLARDLGLSRMAATVAAVCFGLGGFLPRHQDWPDMLQSSIWVPVVILFSRRALIAPSRAKALTNACYSGLAMGMAVLAGRLHMVMMQAVAVAALTGYYFWQSRRHSASEGTRLTPLRAVGILAVVATICFASGAVQWLPSFEYSNHSYRWVGETGFPSREKIPYFYASAHTDLPESLLAFVFPFGFNGTYSEGEFTSPYLGIFPLFLIGLAILKRWRVLWVRFLTLLALAAWLYALGPLSLLHGISYAVIPMAWMMREASRMMYLVSFSLALLAGFGAEVLFTPSPGDDETPGLDRFLYWVAIAAVALLAVAGIFNLGLINYWNRYSIVLILLSYLLYRIAQHNRNHFTIQCVAVALILFDLSPYDWTVDNRLKLSHDKREAAVDTLRSAKGAAEFLHAQPGMFRVAVAAPSPPNIGDAFSIFTTSGKGATVDTNYMHIWGRPDLLNVRFTLKRSTATDPAPVYADQFWKVYRNANAAGPAWIVHQASLLPLTEIAARVYDPQWDALRIALVDKPLSQPLDPCPEPQHESTVVERYTVNSMRLRVHALARGVLVLSEIYDAGWRVSLNGSGAPLLRVDGALRGVVVPAGDSVVELRYRPTSFWLGALLTLLTFAILAGVAVRSHIRTRAT